MPYPIAPGDTLKVEVIFTNASGTPIDVTPAPTVDVFYTSPALAITQPVEDAAMVRASPSKTGSYYYSLNPASDVALGTGIELVATTTDTNVPAALRTVRKRFVVGVTEVDLTPVLDAIGAITAGQVTVTSPVDALTGNLELIRGDSYHAAEGRALSWASDGWTPLDLSAAKSVTFKARSRYSSTVFEKEAEVISDTLVRLELDSDETDTFVVGRDAYRFDLEAELAGGEIVTLAQGKLSVVEDVR